MVLSQKFGAGAGLSVSLTNGRHYECFVKPFGNSHCLQYCFMAVIEVERRKIDRHDSALNNFFSLVVLLLPVVLTSDQMWKQPILPLIFHAVLTVSMNISNSLLLVCSFFSQIQLSAFSFTPLKWDSFKWELRLWMNKEVTMHDP